MQYFVYILECSNNSFYTGYTTDLERRYEEHCEGSAKCKFTRSFPPKKLAASWVLNDLSTALKVEMKIKSLSKHKKEELVNKVKTTNELLSILFPDL